MIKAPAQKGPFLKGCVPLYLATIEGADTLMEQTFTQEGSGWGIDYDPEQDVAFTFCLTK
jgi:hypothetical protein